MIHECLSDVVSVIHSACTILHAMLTGHSMILNKVASTLPYHEPSNSVSRMIHIHPRNMYPAIADRISGNAVSISISIFLLL